MTSRERVQTALQHREPDRVPLDFGSCGPTGIHAAAYRSLLDHLGLIEEIEIWDEIGQLARPSEALLQLLEADVRGVRAGSPKIEGQVPGSDTIRDSWGTLWHRSPHATCYSIVDYPLRLATLSDLRTFRWPAGRDRSRVVGLRERARYLKEQTAYAVLGEISGHILERGQMIRGFEQFLEDLASDRRFADELMDRILEVELDITHTFLGEVGPYLDVFAFKDDLGMQSGPLISPAMFRRCIKPRLKELIQAARSQTNARIWFHSCGSVYYAIPDLIEIGVDILNPVQVRAANMDTHRLKREFGNDLAFWGGIDTQQVLSFGSPADVEDEVNRRILDLAPGGGYVLATVHNIEADVPGQNVWAMARTALRSGRYPIRETLLSQSSDPEGRPLF